MTHLSKIKLEKELGEKIFHDFINIFNKSKNKKFLSELIDELFTNTEKQMLAKRLAIIAMLSSKVPQHYITDMLKVSPTTVAKTSLKIEIGKYNIILKILKNDKDDFEKMVWNILTVGGIMKPKIGRKYWKKISK